MPVREVKGVVKTRPVVGKAIDGLVEKWLRSGTNNQSSTRMPQAPEDQGSLLSPSEMKLWLRIEAKTARLAAARRIREAKSLVEDYSSGRLSSEEANLRLTKHEEKWGLGARDENTAWQLRDEASAAVVHTRKIRSESDQKQQRRR